MTKVFRVNQDNMDFAWIVQLLLERAKDVAGERVLERSIHKIVPTTEAEVRFPGKGIKC